MIKLMIVDDEALIRSGIATVVNWSALGIEVVGEAANGRDALNRALLLRPDIVITDIKMPIIDGLEFARCLKKQRPDTRVVLLTGYSDFSYTQQAIQLGAVDYLLKPVCIEDLEKLMRRLCADILAKREEKMRQIAAQQILARNMPIMRGEAVTAFLSGCITEENFLGQARELGVPLAHGGMIPIALDIDEWDRHRQVQGNTPVRYSVLNIAEETLGALGSVSFGYLKNESGLFGILCAGQDKEDQVIEACRQLQFYVHRFFYFTLTASIGKAADDLGTLRTYAQYTLNALDRKIYAGKNQIILAGNDAKGNATKTLLLEQEDENALKEAFSMHKKPEVQKKLDDIFHRYFSGQVYSSKTIKQFGLSLLVPVLRALADAEIEPQDVYGTRAQFTEELEHYETLEEICLFVKNVYDRAIVVLEQRQSGNYRHIVREGIRYVQQNYENSIQVTDVAAHTYVSPNYFSKIFKEETGENFTEWLNKFRVEKAKALILQNPGDKVYEIAAKVGFNDYKYFAFIFKKYTGYTPRTFRELNH